MEHAPGHEIKRHVKIYVTVFAALAALTLITVGVSTLHLPPTQAILLALGIATIKGSLVALFFMHLISERKIIFLILTFAALFFLAMMVLMPLAKTVVPAGYVA